jgi:hypothetical protein
MGGGSDFANVTLGHQKGTSSDPRQFDVPPSIRIAFLKKNRKIRDVPPTIRHALIAHMSVHKFSEYDIHVLVYLASRTV